MEKLPHLKFIQKIIGNPRFRGGGGPNERSNYNREYRIDHSKYLRNEATNLKSSWKDNIETRGKQELAPLDDNTIPVFLQINPDLLNNINFDLLNFEIEIISEEENGFIIGASLDGLNALEEKIKGFADQIYGTAKIADLWEITVGEREDWKPKHILSEELFNKWSEIDEKQIYKLEVGIAFDKPLGKEPDPSKQGGIKRLEEYKKKQIERDDMWMKRETHFDSFIDFYGKRTSSFVDLEDSFSCEIEITGIGLKDLVVSYPFVFEVTEGDEIEGVNGGLIEVEELDLEILPPNELASEVGVIDSGIMEGNKYLTSAINEDESKSYVQDDVSTADKVSGGGHGTKVAGAILYPNGVSNLKSPYQLPCRIRNLRVLDKNNSLTNIFPAQLMVGIADENEDCSIFNLSINAKTPFRRKHMSTWAATLDTLIYNKNILFIVSAGNIDRSMIRGYITNGLNYPNYLEESFCSIANPAQSSFSLVVGSVNHEYFEDNDWKSLGGEENISAFSRIGSGIWGMVKPDVVEFGGGLVLSKNGLRLVRENEITSPELIRSTLHGGSVYGSDSTGTSFAAPKVSNIVARLKELYPDEDINLIRALVVQGARLPDKHFLFPTQKSIKFFGYGIPSLERVTNNTKRRVTFYNTSKICAEEGHIYSLKIPDSINNPANEFDVLIEVTLSFTAKVRRTRQKSKSYLSTWLEWVSSYFDETLDDFKNRVLKKIEGKGNEYDGSGGEVIKWNIRENKDWGNVRGYNRNNSSVQKDWVVIKAFQLSDEISFAVQGHKGWDSNKEEIPYALTVSIEALDADVPIYENIRIENEVEIEQSITTN